MNNLDKQYTALLQDILNNGHRKGDRTGTGTISVFGRQIRHNMKEGFPLLTTKKMFTKGIVTELLWFLRGDTNIKFLVDNDCHIWDGDCYKNYCKSFEKQSLIEQYSFDTDPMSQEMFINKIKTDDEFAKKWGDLGSIYGKQWRSWTSIDRDSFLNTDNIEDPLLGGRGLFFKEYEIDQIANLIRDLKTNPDSRRLMVNAWNVGELDSMVLPPCHYGFQVYTRELTLKEQAEAYNNKLEKQNYNPKWQSKIKDIDKLTDNELMTILQSLPVPTRAISLMWNQRSVDTFLGLPFNIASYGLLLEIIAKAVNMVPDELIFNSGDTHLYSNHIEQAKEQIGRSYTYEERNQMLKESMGEEEYWKQFKDMAPFGGGLSEYYDSYKIPRRTREPYPLPTLKINSGNENWNLLEIDEIINSLDPDITFKVENYQSHPTIKAPLSN
jgi:thymidylate synthase